MKRFISILVFCLLLITSAFPMFACQERDTGNPSAIEGIDLNKTTLETLIGDTNLLFVKEAVDEDELVWTTSNAGVATVSQEGLVESISVGTAKIKATYGKYSSECTVTVSMGTQLPQLIINNEKSEYRIGKNDQNFAFETYVSFNGKKFYDAQVEYISSDENIATFDQNGKLCINDTGKFTVSFSATWRGMNDGDFASLYRTIEVEIVEEVYFYISGKQYTTLNLSTVSEFEGQNYVNEIEFVPTANLNGTTYSDINVTVPNELVEIDGNVLRAIAEGTGTIMLSFSDATGSEYTSSVNVSVMKPQAEFGETLNYFSTYSGTFKDVNNDYADTTIAKKLFGSDNVEGFKASYDGEQLQTENGKILGMPNDYRGSYQAVLTVESAKVKYFVTANVYAIVVQKASDLELFALKKIKEDLPETYGIDETQITCIDGYSIMLNDIDATGITIPHEVFNTTFPYVDKDGKATSTNIDGIAKRYNESTTHSSAYDTRTEKFGFIGTFNGNGYTIFNLNTSVESGKVGGGLFGYLLGNAKVSNFALVDLNITNSSGIAYAQNITNGRDMPTDKRGLRTDNTLIEDVYIKLAEQTVNPKGALLYKNYNYGNGLTTLSNVIVDAVGVKRGSETAGGILVYEGIGLCAENISTRFFANDVYLITDEYPASFNTKATVYGKNLLVGNILDGATYNDEGKRVVNYTGDIYSTKFMQYQSVAEMKLADLDYSTFDSSSWMFVDGYPVFKTAEGAYPNYDGELVFDGTIKVNSTTNGKQLTLSTFTGEPISVIGYTYNSAELNITSDGVVTLASTIAQLQEYTITVQCNFNNKLKEITIKVLAYPDDYTIATAIETSAYDGVFNLEDYVKAPKDILSVSQTVGGQTYNVNVMAGGILKGLQTVIKSDYSDVEVSELLITTSDMQYRFTNVKVYTHIISEVSDLEVFKHTKSTGRINGYYVLERNINANGYSIGHDETLFSSDTSFDNTHAFQGVLDGRGFAIYNFRPTMTGLLGSVYSDSEDNGGRTVIKNLAFINLISQSEKNFTVFGKFMESAGTQLTEITNVHVQIDRTYVSNYDPTVNYKGLFYCNSSTSVNTFKFKNVYVAINNEDDHTDDLYRAHGSILSRDSIGISKTQTARSSRFENVITITKMNPSVYRQFVGASLAEEFDYRYMYVAYSENDIGKQGMRCVWMEEGKQYYHNPIAEDSTKGSYIYSNVYRYDKANEVEADKIETLVSTGMWRTVNGNLYWASQNLYNGTDPEINFDVDWIL